MLNLIEFAWVWMRFQNLQMPKHHVRMARFFMRLVHRGAKRLGLLMAFRNSGKSTLTGIFCAWILYLNPNARILILSADNALAKKMVRNIKRILEMHPLTRRLIPPQKEEWASDRLTVSRTSAWRDPSVLACGLGSNMTGSRADIIICDDVEVPKNCDTPLKRARLRQKLTELDYILTPCGMMLYIGTPHAVDTIYQTNETGFLRGFETLKIPILTQSGVSAWPERFSLEKIDALRRRSGERSFAAQMMLIPTALSPSRLNPDHIRFYGGELTYTECNGTAILSVDGVRLRSVSCWWDPSFGGECQDGSVIACVFTDENGSVRLHDLAYIKVPDQAESATAQCRQVVQFVRRHFIGAVHIETNGIGKFLPALLKKELALARVGCAVIEEISTRAKSDRILSALEVPLLNGQFFAHERIKQTPFIAEMRDWMPLKNMHDDGLDAVAGCLLLEPVRLSGTPIYYERFLKWRY